MTREESKTSIRTRISKRFGFQPSKIILLEGSFRGGRCMSVAFCVCGLGWETDFSELVRSEAYDGVEVDFRD